MKKQHAKKVLRELISRGWKINESDGTVTNPKTGRKIKIKTALGYGPDHPAYAAAARATKSDGSSNDNGLSSKSNKTVDNILNVVKNDPELIGWNMDNNILPNITTREETEELMDYFEDEATKLETLEREQEEAADSITDVMWDIYDDSDSARERVPRTSKFEENPEEAFEEFLKNAEEDGKTISEEQKAALEDKIASLRKTRDERKSIEDKYETHNTTASGTLSTIRQKLRQKERNLPENNLKGRIRLKKLNEQRLRRLIRKKIM